MTECTAGQCADLDSCIAVTQPAGYNVGSGAVDCVCYAPAPLHEDQHVPAAEGLAAAPRVEIRPGVEMPLINLGGVHSKPSNYSLWLELGGRGLDSALM